MFQNFLTTLLWALTRLLLLVLIAIGALTDTSLPAVEILAALLLGEAVLLFRGRISSITALGIELDLANEGGVDVDVDAGTVERQPDAPTNSNSNTNTNSNGGSRDGDGN